MPAVGSGIDTDQEQSLQLTLVILISGMQSGNMASHGFASLAWA